MIGAIALLDASVLYPAPLRDALMHLAANRAYRPRVSPDIHEEWITALLGNRRDLSRTRLERTRDLINHIDEDALVRGYESLIDDLTLPDPEDRHVLAAALHGTADVIVTRNLKDFPDAMLKPLGVVALSPDSFISSLLTDDLELVCEAVRNQRMGLKRPPQKVETLLNTFEKLGLRETTETLRAHQDKL